MVVQLLIFYYVMLPLMGIKLPGVRVAMVVFGLNSGAYISEIMRSGIQSVDPGQRGGTCSRSWLWPCDDPDRDPAGSEKYSSDSGQ